MSNPLRCVAIIQARLGSSRLPGKVLLDLAGQPMLARVLTRVQRASSLDEVCVATTTDASDDPLAEYCRTHGIPCLRGSQFDVLDRYVQAARTLKADIIVRITGDCPLSDPALIDETVQIFKENQVDFLANRLPPPYQRSYPIGLDIEICTFSALERAWQEAQQTHEREHVLPYLYEGVTLKPETATRSSGVSPHGFRVLQIQHVPDYGSLRWTVDTVEDLEFMRRVFEHFSGRDDFAWQDVLNLVQSQPTLEQINAGVSHKHLRAVDGRSGKEPA